MEYLQSTVSSVSDSIQSYLPKMNPLRALGPLSASPVAKQDDYPTEKQSTEKQPVEKGGIEAGQTARSSFKQYVLEVQDYWQTKLFPLYTKQGVSEKQLQPVHTRIETAIQWFRAHPNPHYVDVLREKNIFIEDIEQLKVRIDSSIQQAEAKTEAVSVEKGKETFSSKGSSSKGSLAEATPYQVFMKAFNDALRLFFRLLFIYFVLRLASISANDVIHKGVMYRLHAFFYTAILFIYTIPYHIVRYILHFFGRWNQPYIIEAGIPLKEVQSPISNIFYSIYSWYRHPKLADHISKKEEEDLTMRKEAVQQSTPEGG